MLNSTEVPHPPQLEELPQIAVLAVLEQALRAAATCLRLEHPGVDGLAECYQGRLPPHAVLLAQLIVERCTELSDSIRWYRYSRLQTCPSRVDNVAKGELA